VKAGKGQQLLGIPTTKLKQLRADHPFIKKIKSTMRQDGCDGSAIAEARDMSIVFWEKATYDSSPASSDSEGENIPPATPASVNDLDSTSHSVKADAVENEEEETAAVGADLEETNASAQYAVWEGRAWTMNSLESIGTDDFVAEFNLRRVYETSITLPGFRYGMPYPRTEDFRKVDKDDELRRNGLH
ncbi:hypothetical protein KEM56_005482, partial [Ascosphaera pollenicola]